MIGRRDRWRLILGRERDRMQPRSARMSRALEELYGHGHGEGSQQMPSSGGGQETAFPSARDWGDELDALFGTQVREEVLGRAAKGGFAAALLEADPDSLTPSVELLEQVLALKGGLSEAHLGRLRRLVQRIVDVLVDALATRIEPALTGLATPRPTRRRGGPLDLHHTLRRNLKNIRLQDDGSPQIIPENLIFKSRGEQTLDWRIILVVDVSASMEASVIYSAMMAAILSTVPWVSVHFVAFSTEIVDLSDHISDPLGLLLEVSVGGGTHIALGLRYARELITVPSRTIVALVSDFEEGYPVAGLLGEVRSLVESGVKPLGLAALNDKGQPRYCKPVAELVAGAGMPVAALTPMELARWIGDQIRG